MNLKVILQYGTMFYSFHCAKEYEATIKRYESDPTAKVIKL